MQRNSKPETYSVVFKRKLFTKYESLLTYLKKKPFDAVDIACSAGVCGVRTLNNKN